MNHFASTFFASSRPPGFFDSLSPYARSAPFHKEYRHRGSWKLLLLQLAETGSETSTESGKYEKLRTSPLIISKDSIRSNPSNTFS